MAVDDHRLAAVLGGPVAAHRQAELVGLAGRLAVQRESRTLPEPRPCISSFMPGVGDDELAAVEHVVADQAVEEADELLVGELRRSSGRASSSAEGSARPCVIWTSRPRSLRTSFMSWLPGTQSGVPPSTMS